ncbi:MAG: sigma-70 family RNA polymerase sigma factor [Saprospiraceae bacterium]|nr:sigma-70 family RNA polymerase sigma factor [Saprospiraceae bacterium]MBK7810550.1 sigma-70 family RNA polymerase sigma factor [Saprospiraceae bacterium]MBK9630140.1 sigma-70 family RNA polymerase sigma factor [Saprospiraceae bacterium]
MTEKEKFDQELLPHLEALHSFAYHLTYNEEDAEDLVQETFIKAFKYLDHYDEGTNAKAWLFKILKNVYINEFRKKNRRPRQVDFEEASAYHDGEDVAVVSYDDLRAELFDQIMGDEVNQALQSIPEEFKTIILLCDIEDFTYQEIAKILDIPVGTVRSRLFRARNMLKDKLKDYAVTMGIKDKRSDISTIEAE